MEMESTVDSRSTTDKVDSILEEKKDDDPKLIYQNEERQERQQRQEGADAGDRKGTVDDNSDDRSQKTEVSVSFGSVIVREYERVIDSTSIYMGLALGWDFNESHPMPVQDKSPKAKVSKELGGEERRMKRTNGSDRYGMLLRYGYKQKELRKATDEAAKFFKQRQREAARSLVVADERKKNEKDKQKPRPLFGSMFRR